MLISNVTQHTCDLTDGEFDLMAGRVRSYFDKKVAENGALFKTNAIGLFDAYLAALPTKAQREHHKCNACRRFIDRFGGLVVIAEDGTKISALWPNITNSASPLYGKAFRTLKTKVEAALVVGTFVSAEKELGTKEDGGWTHFSVKNPKPYTKRVPEAHEVEALDVQNYGTLERALVEFKSPVVTKALTLLSTDSLYRAEKVIGPVKFLSDLQVKLLGLYASSQTRRNLIWKAVAGAPVGFCTPRGGMAGTLLEDLANGLPQKDVAAKFKAKMHPLAYQRPQAAPKAGTIAQAEKLVDKLGLDQALRRRWALLSDIETLWKSKPKPAARPSGTFGHLRSSVAPAPTTPVQVVDITFARFRRTILPSATAIDVQLKAQSSSFGAMTTGPEPLLFQWDNPVSWYLYHNGSNPYQWGLSAGWTRVEAISLNPSSWAGRDGQQGAMLVLEGAKDTRNPGLALFPETIRSELHGVRSVIEAHSNSMRLMPARGQNAAGLIVSKNTEILRVQMGTTYQFYRIALWD